MITGSGSFDLTGLTLDLQQAAPGSVDPNDFFLVGPASPTAFDSYIETGGGSGPGNIGTGTAFIAASSGSGDIIGIDFAEPAIALPDNYLSGAFA